MTHVRFRKPSNAMQVPVQTNDLVRVQQLMAERERLCKDIASQVARGDATMAELMKAQEQLGELQVLAAAIENRAPLAPTGAPH